MSFIPDNLQGSPAQSQTTSLLTATTSEATSMPSRSFNDPSYLMEINAIRAKVASKTHSKEDMVRLVKLLRETRGSTPSAPKAKTASTRTSSKAAAGKKPDGQALLDLL